MEAKQPYLPGLEPTFGEIAYLVNRDLKEAAINLCDAERAYQAAVLGRVVLIFEDNER